MAFYLTVAFFVVAAALTEAEHGAIIHPLITIVKGGFCFFRRVSSPALGHDIISVTAAQLQSSAERGLEVLFQRRLLLSGVWA